MLLREFYEKRLKNDKKFKEFILLFLDELLLFDVNKTEYIGSAIKYLFYDDNEFLYKIKYSTFRKVDSDYLEKVFDSFMQVNQKWVDFLWDNCENKEMTKKILAKLGNKKIEVIKTITMPSFKSLENDVKNSEIITNMLNSIVNHLQQMQKNQNLMLANISHEMRTPLNSVIGYLDILDSVSDLSAEEKKNVTYAKNSSKLLLTLINDLLDTQKLSNATLDLIKQPFWINKVIKSAVLISAVNANQKDIEFVYFDKTDLFNEVIGDENRFLQILNNLFSNAVKFTPKKGKVEILAYTKDLEDKVEVNVKVKDTGMGIPKDKQKGLFKPFSRATKKEKGTGLGLYISKQLANRMGGDIWFESEEGKGSTFYLRVVFEKSRNFYDKNILKGKNIVILKDNSLEAYCNNIKSQLTEIGSKVKIFSDANLFMKFVMFNKKIDMVIIIYPNKIEENKLDESFIKTYKNINEENTIFVAGVEDNYYLTNQKIFNRVISTPLTILDLIETFTQPTMVQENYKYLIIDDEPMNRMVLSTMIKTFDKEAIIEVAVDGEEGLEKIKENKYDFIFLDKRMPKLDGYQVLEKLSEMGLEINNIYLLTADGDKETIAKAKEYNVGYISKPVTLHTLKRIINNAGGVKYIWRSLNERLI